MCFAPASEVLLSFYIYIIIIILFSGVILFCFTHMHLGDGVKSTRLRAGGLRPSAGLALLAVSPRPEVISKSPFDSQMLEHWRTLSDRKRVSRTLFLICL